MTYNFNLQDRHLIFQTNEGLSVLVDTGSPITIHTHSQLSFEGTNYAAKTVMQNINVNVISELVGANITTLLGADILSNYKVCLDYHNLTISFEPLTKIISEGERIPVLMYMDSLMLLPVQINGQNVLGYLDTGAKLSYISKQLTNNLVQNDLMEQDYYIGMGNFTTNTFSTSATLSNGFSFLGKFGGNLPTSLANQFFGGQRQSIIGSDFFFACKKVWLDYSNYCIHIVA